MSSNNGKYQERIYQLDELILDVYNAVYARSGGFKTRFMDANDLKMERFKTSDYNLDTIFEKTIVKFVDNYPTGLMLNGKSVEQFLFKRKGETHVTTIRIVPYINKNAVDNMNDPVNVNQIIRTLLSELVVNDKTNNILLPIINVDIIGSDLSTYNKIFPKIDKNKYYSVQITERFYKLTRLDQFLRDYPLEPRIIKSIIYQAVDVLYRISESYPTFRYNQFIPEMIDCYLKTKDNLTYPEIKLGDFYLAEINDVIDNNYIKNADVNIPFIDSIYSDLYQLLNYLWNRINVNIRESNELVALFDQFLPEKIRSPGSYLTEELWNSLSNEEKFDLRIKNIKNSTFFTSKDSLINTDFVNNDVNGELSGGQESVNELTNNQLTENDDIERTDYDTMIDHDDDEESDSGSLDTVSEEDEPSRVVDLMEGPNKKYYNNDIDNMSNKKSNRRNNGSVRKVVDDSKLDNDRNLEDEMTEIDITTGRTSDYPATEEPTEEKTIRNRPSRIINISESDSVSRRSLNSRPKTYQGRRMIGENKNRNNGEGQINSNSYLPQNGQQYDNTIQSNGVPSRINSIGGLFGMSANEFNSRPQPSSYEQIAQQMLQQQQQPGLGQFLPSNMPVNTTAQIPMPIQNPGMPMMQQMMPQMTPQMQSFSQNPSQASDTKDALYRYLAATSQNPSQQQIDPAMMAMLMQQQQTPPQMAQMPYQQMGIPAIGGQTGGARNPFFFQ